MRQWGRSLALVLLLTASFSAEALSDFYYSQGLDNDFKLAEENETIKAKLESTINRIMSLINPDGEGSMSINFSYFTEVEEQVLENLEN